MRQAASERILGPLRATTFPPARQAPGALCSGVASVSPLPAPCQRTSVMLPPAGQPAGLGLDGAGMAEASRPPHLTTAPLQLDVRVCPLPGKPQPQLPTRRVNPRAGQP